MKNLKKRISRLLEQISHHVYEKEHTIATIKEHKSSIYGLVLGKHPNTSISRCVIGVGILSRLRASIFLTIDSC